MVFFNYALRKLNAKIVYYGPGLCGKTTNLQWIHDHFEGGQRGKMISLATEGDRTIFFDLLPIDIGTIRGMDVTLQLYTVPGQVHYNSTRQLVLRGADGVVFVADSQRTMKASNVESFENLQENLMLQGLDIKDFPHVLQFNKRDLRDLLSVEDLNENLNTFSTPIFEAVATDGIGVQETLEGIVKLVMRNLREKYEPMVGAGGPQAPGPMPWDGSRPMTPAPTPTPAPASTPAPTPPPAPSPPPAATPPPPAAQAAPPPVVESPPVPEVTAPDSSVSDAMDEINLDLGMTDLQDEDQIHTKVYEEAEEHLEIPVEEDSDDGFSPVSPTPVFAVDRDAPGAFAEGPQTGEFDSLFTDPRDENGTQTGSSADPEPPVAEVAAPAPPTAEVAAPAPPAAEVAPPMPPADLSTDPENRVESPPEEEPSESMDELFAPEEEADGGEPRRVVTVGPDFEVATPPASVDEKPSEAAVAPPSAERYEDRIQAPGPFAPAPPSAQTGQPSASTVPDPGADRHEIDPRVRQALGASEDRESLASLRVDDDDSFVRAPVAEPIEPPEVQPVVPPLDALVDPPEVESSPAFDVEHTEEPAFDASADTVAMSGQVFTSDPPVETPSVEEPAAVAPPMEDPIVEPPVVDEPAAPAPPIAEPVIEPPAVEESAVPPPSKDDDLFAKSQPIVVGDGVPFRDDAMEAESAGPEIVSASAAMIADGKRIDVTAEDNQLHLQLKGSGAIAEMGQVRALDIEVPVPGQWVGNRKVTLQLRLTLTPAEEEND